MTDERVAGLPDAGTIKPGDPGHIDTHDRMAELMEYAAQRIGIILDPPPPKPAVIGEYGHVDAHNTLLANIEQIAAEAGTAVGGPPAPVLTNPEGGTVIAFTSGGEGAGGPTIAYGAEIEPNDNGETVTVDAPDPAVGGEVAVSGTQPFTDYIVTVYGVNVAGRGESATTDAFQLNHNQATGGDVPEGEEFSVTQNLLDNQTGNYFQEVGERWRYHTFTSPGDFTVGGPDPFRILLVAGGGGGDEQFYLNTHDGNRGGGAEVVEFWETLPSGTEPVVVGMGGANMADGTDTTYLSWTARAGKKGNGSSNPSIGGASGNGFPGGTSPTYTGGGAGAGGAGNATVNGPGVVNDIMGVAYEYGKGGGGLNLFGAGGVGGPRDTSGGGGIVVIAYLIGTSTTRQMEQAEAEAAAREAGYATGYDVGVTDGREQRDAEFRETIADVKDAVNERVQDKKETRPTKDKK